MAYRGGGGLAFRFEGLEIWHLAQAYASEVYEITARFPPEERYGLATQLNRAVNSIALNIAEGSGQSTNRQFNHYLGIAVGSVFEVVAGLFLARDRGYVGEVARQRLYDSGDKLGRKINAVRKTLR